MSVQDLKAAIDKLEPAELKALADFIAERISDYPAEMDEARFWSIIEQLDWQQEGDDDAVLAPAATALSHFSETAIRAFADIQAKLLYQLDGKSYADAYAAEEDYLSADGFLYARCAVVANGRETYYKILSHPEQMPSDIEFEALLRLPEQAWRLRTGKTSWDYLPAYNYETGFNEEGWGSLAIKL
ncbi:MAG: DUF4240 domain-containing protein [Lewinellaceae bacterium]|nr:DUF4240 domain-containing protein [Lewinellaceae bacterium]MCB9345879.1 DUF4240 domain-containing protein [Lewinellaceae bacterium]